MWCGYFHDSSWSFYVLKLSKIAIKVSTMLNKCVEYKLHYVMVHTWCILLQSISFLGDDLTCLIRVAEDGLLFMGPRSMSHPHRDGKGLLQAGAHHAVRNLDSLGTVELKDLVTVMSIVCGQSNSPVGRAAGCRQKLYSAWTCSFIESGQSRKLRDGWKQVLQLSPPVECLYTTKRV